MGRMRRSYSCYKITGGSGGKRRDKSKADRGCGKKAGWLIFLACVLG